MFLSAAGENVCFLCHENSKISKPCMHKDPDVTELACRISQIDGQINSFALHPPALPRTTDHPYIEGLTVLGTVQVRVAIVQHPRRRSHSMPLEAPPGLGTVWLLALPGQSRRTSRIRQRSLISQCGTPHSEGCQSSFILSYFVKLKHFSGQSKQYFTLFTPKRESPQDDRTKCKGELAGNAQLHKY